MLLKYRMKEIIKILVLSRQKTKDAGHEQVAEIHEILLKKLIGE